MKKILLGAAAIVLVIALGTTGALAAGRHGQGRCFTDANGDGVCDYWEGHCGVGYTDADGDGVCDHWDTRAPLRDGTGRRTCHSW